MRILIKTTIDKNFQAIFRLFDESLFRTLKPPMVRLTIERFDGCKKGDEVHLIVSGKRWVSHIIEATEDDHQISFVDRGVVIPSPIKEWLHTHRIERISENQSMVIDDIEYTCGNIILDSLIYPVLYSMFSLRRPIYKKELS